MYNFITNYMYKKFCLEIPILEMEVSYLYNFYFWVFINASAIFTVSSIDIGLSSNETTE